MPKRVQIRRGTTAQTAAFTGAPGEVTYNTETKRLTAHDGSTPGGHPQALLSEALLKGNNLGDVASPAAARASLGVFSQDEVYSLAGVRVRAPRLYYNGITAFQTYVALPAAIGTNEFTARLAIRYPATAGTARTIGFFSTSNAAPAAGSFAVQITAAGELEVRLYGATTSDYSYQVTNGVWAAFAGKVVELHLVRNALGLFIYVNGVQVATAPAGAFGTAPGFTGSVAASYFVFGSGMAGTAPFFGEWLGFSLFNYAFTAAQSAAVFVEGVPVSDVWPTAALEYISATADRDLSAASNWANVDLASYDESGDLSLVASSAGQKCKLVSGALLGAPTLGKRYRLSCTAANLAGGPFAVYSAGGDLLGTISANGNFVCTFVPTVTFGDLEVRALAAGSVDLDNFSLQPGLAAVDLSFREASNYCVPGRQGGPVADAVHSAAGAPSLMFGARTGLLLRGQTNTNGNQQVFGVPVLRATARIAAVLANVATDGTAVTSLSVGNASGGTQIVNAAAVSAGLNDLALAGRFSSTGNLWVAANGTSTVTLLVLFDDVL